jgi:hypothetical protein
VWENAKVIGSICGHEDDGGVEQHRLGGHGERGVIWGGSSSVMGCCHCGRQPKQNVGDEAVWRMSLAMASRRWCMERMTAMVAIVVPLLAPSSMSPAGVGSPGWQAVESN